MTGPRPGGTLHGDALYRLLPEVYRERDTETAGPDETPHLLRWLDAHGGLLDALRGTLDQMYADHFPEGSDERTSQDWVVPYLGDLVGARPVSPFAEGQRAEVANAIGWRKRKGTLAAIEAIVEAVAQTEGEVQEGFRRVITTARPDAPLLPALSLGADQAAPADVILAQDDPAAGFKGLNPQLAARHPGLAAATPDTRMWSRAVLAEPGTPGARPGRFGGSISHWPRDGESYPPRPDESETPAVFWRQVNPNGAPCLPGTYEDVSRRTVDMRSPDPSGRRGRHHPRAIVIYLPPPQGLSPTDAKRFTWPLDFDDPDAEVHGYIERLADERGVLLRNRTSGSVVIDGPIDLGPPPADPGADLGADLGAALGEGERFTWRFERLRLDAQLPLGPHDLSFRRCAVREIAAAPAVADATPRLELRDCLVSRITGGPGIAEMEHVTVLERIDAEIAINASEVIFPDAIRGERLLCARYSRLPARLLRPDAEPRHGPTNTAERPLFFADSFGTPGAGVLRPETPPALLGGAEDGGEIGAFHAWAHAALREALGRKLAEYMPLGTAPVLTFDTTLECAPPALVQPE